MKITSLITASFFLFSSGSLLAEEAKSDAKQETEKPTAVAVEEPAKKPVKEELVVEDKEFEQETLFTSKNGYNNGGYGGATLTWGKVLDKDARFFGGRGGWIINHSIIIGGGGYGMVNDLDAPDDELDRVLDMGYGGFMIGYTFASHKKFHLHTNLLLGGGSLSLHEKDRDDYEDDKDTKEDHFSVIEPEVSLDMNINTWFRIGVGASYRYVQGVSLLKMEDKDFSGANAVLNLKFGSF